MILPLQTSIDNFALNDVKTDPVTIIVGLSIIAAIIAALVIYNSIKKPSSGGGKSGTSGGGGTIGIFLTFKIHSLARNIGLSGEQTKMFDFILKTDGVTDPEASITNPALLDRHFRRAFRIIENGKEPQKEIQRKLAVLFSTRNILENSSFGGITSTKQIKDDTTLTISNGKDKLNVSSVSAKGENLVVEMPKTILGSQVKIPKGTKISVVFFTKSNKGFSFETRVVGYSSYSGLPTLLLAHSGHLRFLSQRRYRRKQAAIACSMFLVYVEGSGKKQRLIVDKRRMNAQVADISVGGCSIKSMAPIQVGARFKIEFMQNNINVAALGQVLRSNRIGANTIIHVRFLRVSQNSMNIINAFVYDYGRE